jgi:hypothetical protein
MVVIERLLMAQAADGNNTTGWLILLSATIVALVLWWAIKSFRVDGKTTASTSRVTSQESFDPELLVVLAAAATAALGTPIVVRRITFLDQNTVSGWAEVGRTALHWSHNLPRNP